MKDIKINTIILGPVRTNCYIVCGVKTNEAIIIDPADKYEKILAKCGELQIKPVAILLTHGHFDHTGAVAGLREALNIPVYAGEGEKAVLSDPAVNGTAMFASEVLRRGAAAVEADVWLKDGETTELAGFSVKAVATAGHTAGGVCYYIEKESVLFSGDTLFKDSFGRTDLPTGDQGTLRDSIINKLFALPEDTAVYPGHGDATTIGYEKENNPIYDYR